MDPIGYDSSKNVYTEAAAATERLVRGLDTMNAAELEPSVYSMEVENTAHVVHHDVGPQDQSLGIRGDPDTLEQAASGAWVSEANETIPSSLQEAQQHGLAGAETALKAPTLQAVATTLKHGGTAAAESLFTQGQPGIAPRIQFSNASGFLSEGPQDQGVPEAFRQLVIEQNERQVSEALAKPLPPTYHPSESNYQSSDGSYAIAGLRGNDDPAQSEAAGWRPSLPVKVGIAVFAGLLGITGLALLTGDR
jgi:hypothetical protein